MLFRIFILLGSLCLLPSLCLAQTYRVGTGCTYATIQDAVNAIPNQGSGTIRVRTGSYGESVTIVNRTVNIIGGHTSCSATAPSPTALSAIVATGINAPAVAFMVTGGAGGTSHSLQIRQVNLANGTGVVGFLAPFPGGGLSVWTDADRSANVTLRRVGIFDNTTEYTGGGVALDGNGSGSLVLLDNSRIFSNTATGDDAHGGGLYCNGNYHIVMQGGSINGNTAGSTSNTGGRGGGIYMDGCSMLWFAHQSVGQTSDDASLRGNWVYGHGGGLYARGGATVSLVGAHDAGSIPAGSSRPLKVHENFSRTLNNGSAGVGAGIYLQGAGTTVTVDRGWIFDNVAQSAGGGAYVAEDAVLTIERSSQVCHNPRRCSLLENNQANTGGGAVFAWNNSQANIRRTILVNNRSGTSGTLQGRGVLGSASGATLRLYDSLMYGSVGSGHAIIANGASVVIQRSTVADTFPSTTVGVLGLNGTSSLSVFDSIIHESDTSRNIVRVHSGTTSTSCDCNVWHDDGLVGLGCGFNSMVADPLFVDRSARQYYLRPGSPAVNYCADYGQPADLEWRPRGILHSNKPALHGPVDLGAYEMPIMMFHDRFEE